MAGVNDNFRTFQSAEEAREKGRKGGIKSGQVRRQKKTLAAAMDKLLDSKVTDPKQLEIIKKSGMPVGNKPTYKDFVVASILGRTIQKGKMDDLLKLQQVIGETISNTEAGYGQLSDLINGLMVPPEDEAE